MVAFPFPIKQIEFFSKYKHMLLKSPEEDPGSFMPSRSHCARNPELLLTTMTASSHRPLSKGGILTDQNECVTYGKGTPHFATTANK